MSRPSLQRLLVLAIVAVALVGGPLPRASAEDYTTISGEGSSWAGNAIEAMRVAVSQFGMTVNYNPSGSSSGRQNWLNGTVDFAASDIPFQFRPEDGSTPESPKADSYAYIPVVAGGTAFMYNLKINGQRVTNLRLSGENVAKIFTGAITKWDDPALKADNPGLTLPSRNVVPVVRSDGSGSTAQFTTWMIKTHKGIWDSYCSRSGRAPACGFTSLYPTVAGMIAQSGDQGVSSYVASSFAEGTIGYVNYSYAIQQDFPVAKVLNSAGYYTEPTPENVSVSLLKARINQDKASEDYLTQILDDVYTDTDKRNYQLSSYSYFILRTQTTSKFSEDKGKTLGAFAYYAMCQAQQQSASLGYSPLPINLVTASFDQIKRIPGVQVQNINIQSCKNPTFSSDGHNVLAEKAPQPQECDKQGPNQCATGTGGAKKISTPVNPSASGGSSGGTTGGSTTGGSTTGETTTGGTTTGGSTTGGTTDGGALVCDPDTGECTGGDSTGGDSGGSRGDSVASATPTVLSASSGWSSTQSLIVLISVMVLAFVLCPALLWRNLSRQDKT